MSTFTASQKSPHALGKLNTNLAHLNSGAPADQNLSPASTRSGTFARLRLGATGTRRSKSLRSLGRTRSEGTMSVYSDATTSADPTPPLPTSASELTLAYSATSSAKSIRDESPISAARSFMHRSSRILLKKSSKSSLNARTLDWIDETRVTHNHDSSSVRKLAGHGRAESDVIRRQISQPFNFHHITHTPADANKSAFYCSTPTRELKGIKALDLPLPASAVECSTDSGRPQLHNSKSMDSFKRISRSSFSTPFPPAIVPPPRKSSRRPPPLTVPMTRQNGEESPTIPDYMLSGRRHPSASSRTVSPKSPLSISTGADDSPLSMMGIAQAVTTPDESAMVVKSELTSPLEDVPEEDDLASQLRSSKSPRQRSSRSFAQRMVRSGSDPVLPEDAQQANDIPCRGSRRVSGHVTNGIYLDLNWDEDINYCYDQLEADGRESAHGHNDSLSSDSDVLYMKERRISHRLSKDGVPLHLRRASARLREQGLGVTLPTSQSLEVGLAISPSMAVSGDDYIVSEMSEVDLPMFTSVMTADLQPNYSPRSSVSQMSKYPSGGSSHAVSSNSSKRTSGLGPSENASTISVPDLVPSSRRRSSSTKHSSILSQSCVNIIEPAPVSSTTVPSSPKLGKKSSNLETPQEPLRKRSVSESASKALNRPLHGPTLTAHVRSASHAVGTSKIPRRPYTLFPPLDRIGASPAPNTKA